MGAWVGVRWGVPEWTTTESNCSRMDHDRVRPYIALIAWTFTCIKQYGPIVCIILPTVA